MALRPYGWCVLAVLCGAGCGVIPRPASPGPFRPQAIATTAHFSFVSDFTANFNDALITAGLASKVERPDSLGESGDAACMAGLPAPVQAGWRSAVDYHAGVVPSDSAATRPMSIVRLELAGVVSDEDLAADEREFVEVVRGIRAAAAPAYRACGWRQQDRANRRWIDSLLPLLAAHESAVAGRLAAAYQSP